MLLYWLQSHTIMDVHHMLWRWLFQRYFPENNHYKRKAVPVAIILGYAKTVRYWGLLWGIIVAQ